MDALIGNQALPSPSRASEFMIHLIEDIILEGSSQERTELALDRADLAERFMVEKVQEKALG